MGTSPEHPGISPAGRERSQKRSGISPRVLCPRPPDGDIPGRRGHPGPRWGYPRPLGDIPGRVGDVPDERGHPRPLARGFPDRLGDIPGPLGDVPPASWCRTAHTQPTHAIKNETRQDVKRCLCDTTRPSESSCCAAVAAARAALVPGGEARTSEPHDEARRGVRRAESPSDHRVRRCVARPSAEQTSRRSPDSASSEGCAGAEPASLRHGKERGRGVRRQGAEARRCGVLDPRAEAPARESTRRLS